MKAKLLQQAQLLPQEKYLQQPKNQWKQNLKPVQALIGASLLWLTGCSSAPEMQECGRIATFLTPPVTQDLYPALITHIDGKPVLSQPKYHLPAGSYQLKVVELIHAPSYEVPLTARQAKLLQVELSAGQVLHLAAKHQQGSADFWQPEIWQTTAATCLLNSNKQE